jgi:uncharacterized damage-inducible protein DinB
MSLSILIPNYNSFNEWANSRITNWLSSIDPKLLYKPVQSSFTSIDYTLQHILRTQRFWLTFITDADIEKINWSVRELEVEQIMIELNEVSTQMKEVFSSFTESDLEKLLHLNMSWAKNNLSRFEYIMHVVNHSTFHRGQIVTIARGLGITEGIVNTDYNFFHL